MRSTDVLLDGFGRVREVVHTAVDGLDRDQLAWRVDPEANSIGWLIWHLTRVQDDHVAEVAGHEQIWTSGGHAKAFDLAIDDSETGYGHTAEQVAIVEVPSAELLIEYVDAVHQRTIDYVSTLTDDDLDRVIDEGWDPPVTLGVRLVSVIGDDLQHAGQAAYLRGLILRADND
jgi:hypothetical protein